jgi:flavin-dependent dehydrogenase
VGVHVVTGQTVSGITGTLRDGFRVGLRGDSIRARIVIAAHGKRTALDRALKRGFMRQPHPYIGVKAHFRGALESPPGTVELHGFPGGYCGISAIEDGKINVCMLARLDAFPGAIPAFIQQISGQNRAISRFFKGAEQITVWQSISQIPFADKSPVEGDILMAGDSAGMIAPLAGDGMSIALHSGMIAAECARRFLSGESDADLLPAEYIAAWRAHFEGRIRLGRLLQASMFTPPLLSLGLNLMKTAPALGDYFVRHTREINQ